MNSEYQEIRPVSISHCDGAGHLRPSAILVDMQELAEAHAATYGFPRERLIADGMCWVLYRQRITLKRNLTYTDSLRITTWPAAVQGPIFPRNFLFETPDGVPVGEAATAWVLMDIHTRRPLRPTALKGEVPASPVRPALPLPGMLRVENAAAAGERAVRYSDVDVNSHMNNTRYIDWVCDLLPYETLTEKGLSQFQVNYVMEARPGETLSLLTLEDEEGARLFLGKREDGKTVFEARTVFHQ